MPSGNGLLSEPIDRTEPSEVERSDATGGHGSSAERAGTPSVLTAGSVAVATYQGGKRSGPLHGRIAWVTPTTKSFDALIRLFGSAEPTLGTITLLGTVSDTIRDTRTGMSEPGVARKGDENRVDEFVRLSGDSDEVAGGRDPDHFRTAFGSIAVDAGYLWYFDFETDGDLDGLEKGQFNRRFGQF
jgi:hypothetical protein